MNGIRYEVWSEPERYTNEAEVRACLADIEPFATDAELAAFLLDAKEKGVESYQLTISVWDYDSRDEYGAPNLVWQNDGECWLLDNELNNPGQNQKVSNG